MMLSFRKVAAVTVSLGMLVLVGCADSKKDDLTVAEAKAAATASLAKSINAAMKAVTAAYDAAVAQEPMLKVVASKGFVSIPVDATTQEEVLAQVRTLVESPALSKILTRSGAKDAGMAVVMPTMTDAELAAELSKYIGSATRSGNTIIYTLNATTVCVYATHPLECAALVAHITLVHSITDADTGTLTVNVDSYAPLVIGYDTQSMYLQVDLAQAKLATAVYDAATAAELPATFVGAVRLTVAVINSDVGKESAAITLGVHTAINIVGTWGGGPASFQMAASDKVFEVAADAGANTATVVVGVGVVDITAPYNGYLQAAHLGGLTGSFVFNTTTKTLTATNVGITGQYTLDEDTTVDGVDKTVTLSTFDATVSGATVTVTKPFAFNLTEDPAGTAMDGALSASATAGTAVMAMADSMGMGNYAMVMSGNVAITGTGIYADGGPINATMDMNSCFTDSVTTKFPFVAMSCP